MRNGILEGQYIPAALKDFRHPRLVVEAAYDSTLSPRSAIGERADDIYDSDWPQLSTLATFGQPPILGILFDDTLPHGAESPLGERQHVLLAFAIKYVQCGS